MVQYTGPSGFTHNAKIDSMLENASAEAEVVPYDEGGLTFEEKTTFLQSFRLAVSSTPHHARI